MLLKNIFGDPLPFVKDLMAELRHLGIWNQDWEIDHLCYKPATINLYEQHKRELLSASTLLTETMINGRPIATFKLHQPLKISKDKEIPLFELPAPKLHKLMESKYDHIEIVLNEDSLESFAKQFKHLQWDLCNIGAQINPDISLNLKAGKVKFHLSSLENVIENETPLFHRNNSKKCIVFSLDGTLLKTSYDLNWLVLPAEKHLQLVRSLSKTFKLQTEKCHRYEGIETLLSVLNSVGVKLALWTSRNKASAIDLLERYHYQHYFSKMQFFEMGAKPYPCVELINFISGFEKVIMIGDNDSDLQAAKNLGISFKHINSIRQVHEMYQFLDGF